MKLMSPNLRDPAETNQAPREAPQPGVAGGGVAGGGWRGEMGWEEGMWPLGAFSCYACPPQCMLQAKLPPQASQASTPPAPMPTSPLPRPQP